VHPPPNSHATHIHNIIYIHRPFIQRSIKSNIHTFEFAIVLGQYSYFYRLGETGCYNFLPLEGTSSLMFYLSIMTCMYRSEQNQICLFHGICHFPRRLIEAKMFPLHLDLCNGWFLSGVSFLSSMHRGSGKNSPFSSTWITDQSII
jgi:hypothetical protein